MNRELIIAALDGKTIQYRYSGNEVWADFSTASAAIAFLAGGEGRYTCRIKPTPVPDKVYFDVVRKNNYITLEELKLQYKSLVAFIKVTVKTDEDGKETKHVEIVE